MCSSFFFWLNVQITYLWKSPLDFPHFLHYHSLFSSSMVLALNLQVWLSVSNHICKIKFTDTKVFNIFPLYIHLCQEVFIKSFSPISKTIIIIYLGVVSPSMSLIVEKVMPNLEASLSYATVVCWNRCAHNISFGM